MKKKKIAYIGSWKHFVFVFVCVSLSLYLSFCKSPSHSEYSVNPTSRYSTRILNLAPDKEKNLGVDVKWRRAKFPTFTENLFLELPLVLVRNLEKGKFPSQLQLVD